MNTLLLIVAVAVIVFVVAMLINKRATGSFLFWTKSQVGKAGRFFGEADPVAQMKQAADDASDNIRHARDALVKSEAMKASLARQIASDDQEIATVTARINRYLDNGMSPNHHDIMVLSEQLARAKKSKATNQKQLDDNAEFYNSTLKMAKTEAGKISEINQRADRLQVRLDLSEAQKKLAELADRFQPGALTSASNAAAKFEEIAERKIEENAARLRVNKEFATQEESDQEIATSVAAQSELDAILQAREQTKA